VCPRRTGTDVFRLHRRDGEIGVVLRPKPPSATRGDYHVQGIGPVERVSHRQRPWAGPLELRASSRARRDAIKFEGEWAIDRVAVVRQALMMRSPAPDRQFSGRDRPVAVASLRAHDGVLSPLQSACADRLSRQRRRSAGERTIGAGWTDACRSRAFASPCAQSPGRWAPSVINWERMK
jgi:hypothetical protein